MYSSNLKIIDVCEQIIKNTNKYNSLTSQRKYCLNNIATRKITKLLQFHKTMTKILQNEIASFVYLFNTFIEYLHAW